jgi:hypothetical protein
MRMAILLLVAVIVLSSPLLAYRKVYQQGLDDYTGCEDTYMIEYRVESNYGSAIYIECQTEDGRPGGSNMKPLIRFNNLGLQGYTVTACTLQLYCYFSVGENQMIQLHEALRDWKEHQVTCLQYSNGLAWTDFACGLNDEDASVLCVSAVVDSEETGWKSLPIPASVVQRWVDAPGDTNNGLLIWAPEDDPGVIKDRSFRSSDMFAPSQRPVLIVRYEDPCGELSPEPLILDINDVPCDNGGFVEISWKRSMYDQEGSVSRIKRYVIWRKRGQMIPPLVTMGSEGGETPIQRHAFMATEEGRPWELVARVRATGDCSYSCRVPTHCDSSEAGTCWTSFYISARTGVYCESFDSPVSSGYSVDNSGMAADGQGETDGPDPTDKPLRISANLEIPEPNPSTETCAVRFEVARSGFVNLRIYDASGRLVTTLVNDYFKGDPDPESGRVEITWGMGCM